eukprot:2700217-Prymnesium_polylepis.1
MVSRVAPSKAHVYQTTRPMAVALELAIIGVRYGRIAWPRCPGCTSHTELARLPNSSTAAPNVYMPALRGRKPQMEADAERRQTRWCAQMSALSLTARQSFAQYATSAT